MDRRKFIQSSVALGVSAAIAGCDQQANKIKVPSPFVAGQPLPWSNWSANHSCTPEWRSAPESVDELISVLKNAKGVVRAVGAGHSFSAVVPTNDTMISTDLLSGLVSHDPEKMQATLLAGTRLNAMGPLLQSVGQAVPNMPDMDYPALGGAIVNSVHATGNQFGSMSSYVASLKLATVNGDLLECSPEKNPQIFKAALTSVGALGIISEITLQNEAQYNLTELSKIENLNDVLEDIDNRCNSHRHFEFFPIPYSSLCITTTTDLAKPGDVNVGTDDPKAVNSIRQLFDFTHPIPLVGSNIYGKALDAILRQETDTIRTGPAHEVFPHTRIVRFIEMEYTVAAELGPACLKEILATVKEKNLPLNFPLEYRYVKGDDIWLSMFEGQNGCSISIHQFADLPYKEIFAEIEPIFWKYNGRPHWGKVHTLDAARLANLYPRHWQDFQAVRRELDPSGKLMNKHLKEIFGS